MGQVSLKIQKIESNNREKDSQGSGREGLISLERPKTGKRNPKPEKDLYKGGFT